MIYITPYLHPIENESEYKNIRKMTPYENAIEKIIEQDPGFLKYNKTNKSMRQNRKEGRRQKRLEKQQQSQNGNN